MVLLLAVVVGVIGELRDELSDVVLGMLNCIGGASGSSDVDVGDVHADEGESRVGNLVVGVGHRRFIFSDISDETVESGELSGVDDFDLARLGPSIKGGNVVVVNVDLELG